MEEEAMGTPVPPMDPWRMLLAATAEEESWKGKREREVTPNFLTKGLLCVGRTPK